MRCEYPDFLVTNEPVQDDIDRAYAEELAVFILIKRERVIEMGRQRSVYPTLTRFDLLDHVYGLKFNPNKLALTEIPSTLQIMELPDHRHSMFLQTLRDEAESQGVSLIRIIE